MPMKNPPHPGELIRDNLDDLGLSVAEGAAGLGITRQQLYNVMNGKSGITPEMAVRLEKPSAGPPIFGCGCSSTMNWRRFASARARFR